MKRLLLEKILCVSRVAINANFSKASVPLLPPVLVSHLTRLNGLPFSVISAIEMGEVVLPICILRWVCKGKINKQYCLNKIRIYTFL